MFFEEIILNIIIYGIFYIFFLILIIYLDTTINYHVYNYYYNKENIIFGYKIKHI